MNVKELKSRIEEEKENLIKKLTVKRDAEIAEHAFGICIGILEAEENDDLSKLNLDMLSWVAGKNKRVATQELTVVSIPKMLGFVR